MGNSSPPITKHAITHLKFVCTPCLPNTCFTVIRQWPKLLDLFLFSNKEYPLISSPRMKSPLQQAKPCPSCPALLSVGRLPASGRLGSHSVVTRMVRGSPSTSRWTMMLPPRLIFHPDCRLFCWNPDRQHCSRQSPNCGVEQRWQRQLSCRCADTSTSSNFKRCFWFTNTSSPCYRGNMWWWESTTAPRLPTSPGRTDRVCSPVEHGREPVGVGLQAPAVSEGPPHPQVWRTGAHTYVERWTPNRPQCGAADLDLVRESFRRASRHSTHCPLWFSLTL